MDIFKTSPVDQKAVLRGDLPAMQGELGTPALVIILFYCYPSCVNFRLDLPT